MNDELQNRLLQYLDRVDSAVQTSSEFVVSQAPDVAQQYLAWTFWESVVWACVLGVIAVAIAIGIVLVWRSDMRKDEVPTLIVMMTGAFFFCGSCSVCSICRAVKVTVAPKVVVLEKVHELTKELR